MSRDRPTSIGIGIIKFNARTNSVCSSPSASCTATALSSRRVDTLSVGAESSAVVEPQQHQQQLVQQRFVELCANDDDETANNSAPVSEADECGSVADEGEVRLVDKAVTLLAFEFPKLNCIPFF
ncbi:hypothetical protein niasHT_034943 [Heterodera trifolii]|uniref:Uncharacterized protein n=1 Tax=Heterodera trifolii TaxID=157864 RepID=A0ABD2IFW7_9BILA